MDQQMFIHLSASPFMVLDIEWPGFVTKSEGELSQIPYLNDDGIISNKFTQERQEIFLGIRPDNNELNPIAFGEYEECNIHFKDIKKLAKNSIRYYHKN